MKTVILVSAGCEQSGKSTVANMLMQSLGNRHNIRMFHFATPLKNMLASLLRELGFSDKKIHSHLYGDDKETPIPELGGINSRQMMRTLGTEWRELNNPYMWGLVAKKKVEESFADEYTWAVFDDYRFPNVEDLPMMEGWGESIKILRIHVKNPMKETNYTATHKSEMGNCEKIADFVILNNGTLAELKDKVYNLTSTW